MANEFKVKKGLIVDGSNTVLDVQGTQGQLFSVTDSLTGDLFSVSDVSGIPILNVNSSGVVDVDAYINVDGYINLSGTTTDYYIGGSGGGKATNGLRIGSTTTSNTVALEIYHSSSPVSLGIDYAGGAGLAWIESVHGSYDINTHMLFKPGGTETWRIGSHGSNASNKFEIRPAAAGNDFIVSDNTGTAIITSDTSTKNVTFAGRISVGGTHTPTSQVHIKNTSGDNRGLIVENTVAASYAELSLKAAREFRIGTGGSGSGANAASVFYVYDATTGGTAGHRLEISSDGDVQARRPRSNTAGDVALSLQPTDSTIHYGFRIDQGNNYLNIDRVDSAGNLMILDYNGNATFTGSITASGTSKIEKAQNSTQFDRDCFLRLHPSATTDSGGYTNMIFGTSTTNNYGVAVGARRAGAGDTSSTNNPEFSVRILNDSITGTEVLNINLDGDATFSGNVTAPSFIGKLMGGATGAPDATIWCVSGDYTDWGIFYDESSPDVIQFKSSGNVKATISLDDGDYTGRHATFTGNITASTGLVTSQTAHFTDNVYLSGGQLYIGASGANATTNDSHRLASGSGAFSIQSREAGTWTNHLLISTSGNATLAGSVDCDTMLSVSYSDISTGENRGLRIINTNGVDQQWNITTGVTAVDNEYFCIRDATYNINALTMAHNSGNAVFAGSVTAGGDVVAYSDERLKTNIETLDGSKVYEMRGVSFIKDEKEGSGVIAQELEKITPELVNNDSEYKAVAYGNITGYLIEAIKELKAEIEELKKQIK